MRRGCGPEGASTRPYLGVFDKARVFGVPVLEPANVGLDHAGTRLCGRSSLCEAAPPNANEKKNLGSLAQSYVTNSDSLLRCLF